MVWFLLGSLIVSIGFLCYRIGIANERNKNEKIIQENNKKVIKALNDVDSILNNTDFRELQNKYKR